MSQQEEDCERRHRPLWVSINRVESRMFWLFAFVIATLGASVGNLALTAFKIAISK